MANDDSGGPGLSRRSFLLTAVTAPAALAAARAPGAAPGPKAPDVVFVNGKVITMDAAGTIASAVAVTGGFVTAVGSTEMVRALAGAGTRVVDLGGKAVVPGFVDAHTHPMETAMMAASWVDGRYPKNKTVARVVQNVADWIKSKNVPRGVWVYVACSSASQNKFEEKRLPTKAELDAVAPDNPVVLANGAHMCVLNGAALRALGIRKGNATLKKGGTVQLDPATGEPTGVVTDGMADIPLSLTPEMLVSYYTKEIQRIWNRYGFTSVMAITPDSAVPVLQAVAANKGGNLPRPTIRYTISVWKGANGATMPADLGVFRMPAGSDASRFRFAGIKLWVDGENDARTGLMRDCYLGHFATDPGGDKGSLVTPQEGCNRFAVLAGRNGVFPMLHASGDSAMDIGLTACEELVKSGAKAPLFRLEHFGDFQVSPDQLRRAAALVPQGLRINVQPTWMLNLVRSDYENMGKKRAETGFNFRTLIDAGLEPSAGSDVTGIYPENVNPFLGIYAVVTRDSDDGLFLPRQAVSVVEALKMWTIWAAKALGEEKVKGSIEVGKYGDLAVLSDDPLTIPADKLKSVTVLKTVLGGDVVYSAA